MNKICSDYVTNSKG